MPDLTRTSVSVATTGILTVTTRIFMNPILAATFSGVNTGQAYPTVTVGTGNAYVDVVSVITPNSPVTQAAAEGGTFYGDKLKDGVGVVQ